MGSVFELMEIGIDLLSPEDSLGFGDGGVERKLLRRARKQRHPRNRMCQLVADSQKCGEEPPAEKVIVAGHVSRRQVGNQQRLTVLGLSEGVVDEDTQRVEQSLAVAL